jgi:hypothetical protein
MIRSQVARGFRGNGLGRGLLTGGEEPYSAIKIVALVAGYGCAIFQRSLELGSRIRWRNDIMKIAPVAFALCLVAWSPSSAQTAAGSSAGSTGAGGSAGTTLSNGSTINGTGGSPGPNTSNALNHGTTGNNLGTVQNPGAGTHGNAVDTPAAQNATQSLGNTDTGILKK